MASVGMRVFSTVEEACEKWVKKEDRIAPELEEMEIYEKAYRVYRNLYSKLKEDFHALSRLEGTQ